MDRLLRELLPLIIIGGSFSLVGAVLYGSWLLGRYQGREQRDPAELGEVQFRLERLEQAMSHVAGSLDRLESAHRHTARMLAEAPREQLRMPGRTTTPH